MVLELITFQVVKLLQQKTVLKFLTNSNSASSAITLMMMNIPVEDEEMIVEEEAQAEGQIEAQEEVQTEVPEEVPEAPETKEEEEANLLDSLPEALISPLCEHNDKFASKG